MPSKTKKITPQARLTSGHGLPVAPVLMRPSKVETEREDIMKDDYVNTKIEKAARRFSARHNFGIKPETCATWTEWVEKKVSHLAEYNADKKTRILWHKCINRIYLNR